MQELTTKTIRDIALEIPLTTRIFEEFKIDYCCGGRRPFDEACRTAGVDPQIVRLKIEKALDSYGNSQEFDYLKRETAAGLIDYILEKHHVFTKKEIVRLTDLMEKVCRKHGAQHPELFDLYETFGQLCDELIPHMRKEEMILFPFIEMLENSVSGKFSVSLPPFRTIHHPVRRMMIEHDTAGDSLRRIRQITDDFELPKGACPSFKALYCGLEDLEKDLHQHIHLENNVLFPQAVKLEEEAFGEFEMIPAH